MHFFGNQLIGFSEKRSGEYGEGGYAVSYLFALHFCGFSDYGESRVLDGQFFQYFYRVFGYFDYFFGSSIVHDHFVGAVWPQAASDFFCCHCGNMQVLSPCVGALKTRVCGGEHSPRSNHVVSVLLTDF